jgi:uncharacterized protein (TIGR01732 family)
MSTKDHHQGLGKGFALIVVLFILLIIVGAGGYVGGYDPGYGCGPHYC